MAARKQQPHPNHERWLVSYADFITLLFAFFVVMFATAQTDNAKTRAVSESVKKALQGDSFKSAFSMLLGGKGDVKGQGWHSGPTRAAKSSGVGDHIGIDAGGLAADFVASAAARDPERPAGPAHDLARLDHQLHPGRAVSFRRR